MSMELSKDDQKTDQEKHIEEALTGTASARKLSASEITVGTDDWRKTAVVRTAPLGGTKAMARTHPDGGARVGLEYLLELDELMIYQQFHFVEAMICWETNNKYVITNNLGQQVYFAEEAATNRILQCCGSQREFVLHITDNFGQEVMRLRRQIKGCAGWCCCADSSLCGYEVQVEAPVDKVCGSIKQLKSKCKPRFVIRDSDGEEILFVHGPACAFTGLFCCCSAQEFKILAPDEKTEQVAVISKKWSNVFQELCADADNFTIKFPADLDIEMKALLLATAFLIDFVYY